MPLQPKILGNSDPLVTTGAVCPIDSSPFHAGDAVVFCGVCKTAHHTQCWQKNGNRCSTLGCTGTGEVAVLKITKEEIGIEPTEQTVNLCITLVIYRQIQGIEVERKEVIAKAFAESKYKPTNITDDKSYFTISFVIPIPSPQDAPQVQYEVFEEVRKQGIQTYDRRVTMK